MEARVSNQASALAEIQIRLSAHEFITIHFLNLIG